MSALVFDTLAYARRMEQVGFTREQAEALAQEQARLIDERPAPKTDIEALRLDIARAFATIRADIEALRLSIRADIEALRLAIKADMRELEQRMTLRLGGMLVVAVGLLLAAIRYLPAH